MSESSTYGNVRRLVEEQPSTQMYPLPPTYEQLPSAPPLFVPDPAHSVPQYGGSRVATGEDLPPPYTDESEEMSEEPGVTTGDDEEEPPPRKKDATKKNKKKNSKERPDQKPKHSISSHSDETAEDILSKIEGKKPINMTLTPPVGYTRRSEDADIDGISDVPDPVISITNCVATALAGLISAIAAVSAATLRYVPAWPVMLFGSTTALLAIGATFAAASTHFGGRTKKDEEIVVARVVLCWTTVVSSIVTWASGFSDLNTPRLVAMAYFAIVTPIFVVVATAETIIFFCPSVWSSLRRRYGRRNRL